MPEPLDLSLQVTIADMLDAYQVAWLERRRVKRARLRAGESFARALLRWVLRLSIGIVSILIVLMALGWLGPVPERFQWVPTWSPLVFIYPGIYLISLSVRMRRARRVWRWNLELARPDLRHGGAPTHVHLAADVIVVESPGRRSEWPASSCLSLVETTDQFVMWLHEDVVALPKRDIDLQQMSTFRALAVEWGQKPRILSLRPRVPPMITFVFGAAFLIAGFEVPNFYKYVPNPDETPSSTWKGPAAPFNEQVLSLPGAPDDPVMLQVTLFTPSGPGRFPLVVMNHDVEIAPPARQQRFRDVYSVYYFLSRGYAVALPMMRGFAGSSGHLPWSGCDMAGPALKAAKDIAAVIGELALRPEIDGTRVVVAGQSFGGWNSLALGTLKTPAVKGLVNFVGGLKMPDCETSGSSLVAATEGFGRTTSIRSIWFYGDNDGLFPAPVWRAMYRRYTAAGGPAELVEFSGFLANSQHLTFFPEGLSIWTPKVDGFLAEIGLPNAISHPEYLPMAPPPSSHYADIEDVDMLPVTSDAGRDLYRRFLEQPLPRAFAVASTGATRYSHGGFDPLTDVLTQCRADYGPCQLYAVDNDVVWTRPTPMPPATTFAALADADAVPFLDDAGRAGYRAFLAKPKPRAFAIAPNGA